MEAQATTVQRRTHKVASNRTKDKVGRCQEVKEEPAKRPPAARRGDGHGREVDGALARKGKGLGDRRDQSLDLGVHSGAQRGRILQRTLRSKHC